MSDREYYEDGRKAKDTAHRKTANILRKVAASLGLEKHEYDIRSNKGGPAVGGEVTLHTDKVYVQIPVKLPGAYCSEGILIRSCTSRKDYSGGINQYADMSLVKDAEGLATRIKRMGFYA